MNSNKTFELVDEILSKAHAGLESLSGEENPTTLYLKAQYYRGLELAQGSINALNDSYYSAASILLRSLLEVYVDFANLIIDKKYFLIIQANDLRNRIRKNTNILKGIEGDDSDIQKEIDQCKERMMHIKRKEAKS